jgi:xylulokinase
MGNQFLGIDIGTSAVKAVLMDDSGLVRAQASAPLVVSRPRPLWSEQNPEDWWTATKAAVLALDPALRAEVCAVGLSGQMHGATLLDRLNRPLRPAILWNDGRSGAECAAMEAECPELPRVTGNRAMPGFTAPKLRWVREHEPDVFNQVAKVLLPKDYVRFRMTGAMASDMSDSAGTLWMDVARRDWSDAMLALTGLDRSHMPELFEGDALTGELSADVARQWGMARAPVAAGGGDNAAGAVGVGVVRPGDAFLSLGTSGVLFLANETYRPNPMGGVHTFCHALPGRWHQMSVILSAASCIDWAMRLCGMPDPASLLARVEARNAPAVSEIFLPYLSGERTPHNDPDAKGVLFGLTHESDCAAIGQAVLEGVAFAFRDGLDALIDTGAEIENITVIGGGSRSAYWGRILASALGRRLTYRGGGEVGPAYGAARLARLGSCGGAVEDVCAPPPVVNEVEPEASLSEAFAPKIKRYRAIYHALKPCLTEIVQ